MAEKISGYPAKTVIHDNDLLDFSNTPDGGSTWDVSQKVTVAELVAYLNSGLSTLYSTDDNLAGDRVVTQASFDLTFSTTGDANTVEIDGGLGYVGIRTIPVDPLHVGGNARIDGNLEVKATGSGAASYKVFGQALAEFSAWADNYTDNGVDDGNNPVIYASSSGGAGPFAQSGNLIIKARNNATQSRIFFITSVGGVNTETMRMQNGRIKMGGTTGPSASALLELESTTTGLRVMRMTAAQATAITPVEGLMLFSTDTDATFTSVGFWGYEGGAWVKL